jgi:hypothetical protein
MTTISDLVTAFHGIDALKGRVCGKCKHSYFRGLPSKTGGLGCRRGLRPADETDGCDYWQHPHHNPDRATMAVVMSI